MYGVDEEMSSRSVMDIICASYEHFFDAEKKIADYILDNKKAAVDMTVAELARASGTSDATVSRFCRRCGFKGYQDLKMALAKEVMEEERDSLQVSNEIDRGKLPQALQNILANKIEEIRQTITITNKYVLREPVSDRELDTILRDDAFTKKCFFKGNKFLHDQFAEYIMRNHNVCLIQDQLCIYQDGVYNATEDALERAIIKELPVLKDSQIKEVTKRLRRISPKKEQSRPTLIAFSNGLYDLETDEFKEFNPNEVILNRIPWPYNPAAYSELLNHTLNKITCNDPGIRALLEEVAGYCLYRRNSLEKALILIGEKGNGKSTFLYIIHHMLGDQNIASLDLKELGDRFKTAELFGKLANIGDDIGDEFIANASTFRKLVTGDRVNAERTGQDPFEFNNYSTFLFSANEIPRIKDKTGAVQRRLAIVPFDAKFTPDDPDYDPQLKYKLAHQEHLEYMIVLSLAGLKRALAQKHFTEPQKVKAANREYEERNNPLIGFIDEIGLDDILNEPTRSVYQQYNAYCNLNKFTALSSIEFSRQICKRLNLKTKDQRIKGKSCKIFVAVADVADCR